MSAKTFTEKEVIKLLRDQRKLDAESLKGERNISGYTGMKKVLKNSLVYEIKDNEKSDTKES